MQTIEMQLLNSRTDYRDVAIISDQSLQRVCMESFLADRAFPKCTIILLGLGFFMK